MDMKRHMLIDETFSIIKKTKAPRKGGTQGTK
jgi:hypothetical protein